MKITACDKDMRVLVLDDLVKVFPDEDPVPSRAVLDSRMLRGDRLSFQIAFRGVSSPDRRGPVRYLRTEVQSPATSWITLRTVENVPVRYAAHAGTPDEVYLRKTRGLYPDLLQPMKHGIAAMSDGEWRALWVDVETPPDAAPGDVPLTILLKDPLGGELLASVSLTVTVLPAALPEQTFPRTEWFHADCLADAYHVEIFSEAHWELLRVWISQAVRRGINMILTPLFTPPLDTAVGWERPAVQLVKVFAEGGSWRFDFSRLERWIRLCQDCGVKYFEMSHLFSQWGAAAAPKIMGWKDGELQRLFGWDTPAAGEEYTRFLNAFIPALRRELREAGVEDRCWFHISDEPAKDQIESYASAVRSVRGMLEGCRCLDALSDFEFYQQGYVESPVCGTNHIEPFLKSGTPHLWSYYCTAQSNHVSNCFIAQPSGLTRMYGIQMYKFGIEGSLRWGFNFYYTSESYEQINPFLVNDCGGCCPAGDPFIVYPDPDGHPLESIRMMILDDAVRDLRALRALEGAAGRDEVLRMIDEGLREPLRFDVFPDYPEDAAYVLSLRGKVNAALCGLPVD